jgi:hypothetical protein
MTSSRLRPLAASPFEQLLENRILIYEDLYDLDGETALRRRDGRIETGSLEAFETEVF